MAFSHLKRLAAQVVAVQLDQVEGVEKYAAVVVAVPQPVEIRYAVFVTGHGLAIKNHRTRAQAAQCRNDQREAIGQVIPCATV